MHIFERDLWLELDRGGQNFEWVDEVSYSIKDSVQTYRLHYHNSIGKSESEFTNECGYSLYEHGWATRMVPANIDIWKLKYVEGDSGVSLKPLAFELQTNDSADIGNYTYYVRVRSSYINLQHHFFEKQFMIRIKPCKVTSVSAPQEIPTKLVYYS